MSLTGYALVTGAGSGLGRGVALAYAESGTAGVVFADKNLAAVETAAQGARNVATNPDFQAIVVQVDVTKQEEVDEMVAKAINAFGRLDYAFNSAGIGVQQPAEISEASAEEWLRFMGVNVMGMFLCVRAQSKAMKQQALRPVLSTNPKRGSTRGVIINMGSAASYVPTPALGQYTTSKHAVLGLTKNAALDNAPHSIRVNCLCPSWVDTPMVSAAIAGNPALGAMIEKAVPMGRIAEIDEISDIVMFLSSDRASYVTGSSWIVDGGTTLSSGLV